MCGIVGFINKDKDKKKIIKAMADRINHRGPDGDGYYVSDEIALGHKRLSIIDIAGGVQPIYNETKDVVIVFNGEIYNYKKLQDTLKKCNHTFKTNSDTEVLVHGYEEWGFKVVNHLRGMFSFAIWDKKKHLLFCARDHFGIKPFYYYQNNETLMFASEIKAFLEHPDFEKVLNKDLLGPFLTFSFTPTTETFFKGVKRLDAGCYLVYQNNELEIKKYYDIEFREYESDYQATIDKIEDTMMESVRYHLESDVEVGSFLSSGIDSSYIVSLAKPNKTYTVGYNNMKYSEIDYAKDLTDKLKIKNINKLIDKKEYMASISKIMYYMDEPCCDAASIALYFLSQLAALDVKVVLSGEGADEFFGGYNTYREVVDMKIYNRIPFFIRNMIAKILENLPEFRGRNFLVRRGKKIEDEYVSMNRVFSDIECKKVLAFSSKINNSDITRYIFQKFEDKDDLVKMQVVDINNWLVKDILHKADRMTMANSLELRVPFVDKEVFRLASGLPKKFKVNKDNTKVALRDAAARVIPNDAYKKKKLGFPVPIHDWIQDDDVYEEIKEVFLKEYVKEFFNQDYILKLLDKAYKNKRGYYKKVWAVYSFLKWYEVYFVDMQFV